MSILGWARLPARIATRGSTAQIRRLTRCPIWRSAGSDVQVEAEAQLQAALDRALVLAGQAGGPLVVAGSLYLVGEARRRWVDDPQLRDPEVPRA